MEITDEILPCVTWRMIKVRLKNNRWIKLKQFSTLEKLYKHLENLHYSDCYYSKEYYLNPNEKEDKLMFLNSDLVLDFDNKDLGMVKKVIDFMKKKYSKLKPRYLLQTGRGYQLVYNPELYQKLKKKGLVGEEREKFYIQERILLVNKMKKAGLVFDYDVTVNKSVIRLPNTFHRNGTLCKLVDYNHLDTGGRLESISDESGIPPRAIVRNEKVNKPKPSRYFYKVISNKISKDSFIGYLSYKKKLKKVLVDIIRINEKYPIDCVYIRELGNNEYDVIIPKVYSRRRWEKILNYSHSNDKDFSRFDNHLIRTSKIIDHKNNIIGERPKLIHTIGKQKMKLPKKTENFIHFILTEEIKEPKPLIMEITKEIITH
mgnify:CR=1 FL=1